MLYSKDTVDEDILLQIYSNTKTSTAVWLRTDDGQFKSRPDNPESLLPFLDGIRFLDPAVALRLQSPAVRASISAVPVSETEWCFDSIHVQLLQSIDELSLADRAQHAAFVREQNCLVIWRDDVNEIIELCRTVEAKLDEFVEHLHKYSTIPTPYTNHPRDSLTVTEKSSWSSSEIGQKRDHRPLVLLAPIYTGLAIALAVYFGSTGVKVLFQEYAVDGQRQRFALCSTLPFTVAVGLFFCLQLINGLAMLFGPIYQYTRNSLYFSAIKPSPNPIVDNRLPHITVHLPVYKESLEETMYLLSTKDAERRIAFYAKHDIGWVARPLHSKSPGGFKRPGQFKKASNLNYGLALAMKLEKHLSLLQRLGEKDSSTGVSLEERALKAAIEETYNETGNRFKPWAENGKQLKVGEIVLLVDSDTVIPEDCFRDAAREMADSPEVAIIQHESGVLQVIHHYFENGIAHFTHRINRCISFGCANGDVAPFVGHNAFLRWSAIQEVSFIDRPVGKHAEQLQGYRQAGVRKFYSETTVSEDMDLSLRLLEKGYVVRWATYANGGFKEGVSLTLTDEVARFQKYACGCNEILFNPLFRWPINGPINKRIRKFLWSNAPVHYKFSVLAYMFSYYGIAASALISIFNYFYLGLAPSVDRFYHKSFEVLLACLVVFPAFGNVSYIVLEWRLGRKDLLKVVYDQMRWLAFFLLFFGGITFHISVAILAHLFSIKMTWTSTGKEVKASNLWKEILHTIKHFWYSLIISGGFIAVIVVFNSDAVPDDWRIRAMDWGGVVPVAVVAGCSILMPIVLSPWITKLVY
ncbi:hypothetical protein D9758_002569 [Tetrapyrgos nigripes]|uniref:Glycosyltransferase 2-like domain-containing protein n=1 Tax=Tetrapyrgos nigripes TaxID=182062 RepID=A0A8H5LTW1_9AGAR|nr:hypothetical protein D9758_002569 [Tetrapyrgos nigripes]